MHACVESDLPNSYVTSCHPECSCSPDGSLSDVCDPVTGQCPCRPHFHGLTCELCSKGYWKPFLSGRCQPCGCDPTRSYSDTCDQVWPLPTHTPTALTKATSSRCLFYPNYSLKRKEIQFTIWCKTENSSTFLRNNWENYNQQMFCNVRIIDMYERWHIAMNMCTILSVHGLFRIFTMMSMILHIMSHKVYPT